MGVEPMEDVEEVKVTPPKPTTTNAESGGNGGKAKKKKNADAHKKNSDGTAVNVVPKMQYAIKKPDTATREKILRKKARNNQHRR
jgi:carbon monoxide dehydrogenase subunit G